MMLGLDDHWAWLILAAVLGILELLVPGVFMIWIGGAALVVGIAALLLPIPIAAQFLLFAVVAFAAVWVGRKYFIANPIVSADPLLNDRIGRLIGEVVTAVEPVDGAHGRVKVGDGVWSARGGPADVGERLKVVGAEKGVLLVERC